MVQDCARYEVLPFAKAEHEAAQIQDALRLTVTTSPKHGIDRSLEVGIRLRSLGHAVTLHVAARMVRSESHLHEIVARACDAGIDDFFVIGGDARTPIGPYASAGELLDVLAPLPLRPRLIGIGAYPEGHPLIDPPALRAALARKVTVADYIVTQLCFDRKALLSWLEGLRARGIDLPVYVGAVGPIERRRLLEISMRIGVGPSLRFVRKQHGLSELFRRPVDAPTRFYDEVAPHVKDVRWRIAGFHFFTFNEMIATRDWYEIRRLALEGVGGRRRFPLARFTVSRG
jgi:methylenetetrahydrofolate reductase (NADPH)